MVELIQSISLKIQSSFVWDLKLNLFEHLCPQSVGFQHQPLPLLLLLFGHLREFVVNPASTDWGWWMYNDMKKVTWRWGDGIDSSTFHPKQTNRNTQGNILIYKYVNIYFYPLYFFWSGGFYWSREISKHCPYQKGVILCSCTDKHRCMCDMMVFMRKLTAWISSASPCLRWLCLWVWKGYLQNTFTAGE